MGLGVPIRYRKHPDRHTAQGFLAFRPTTGVTMQIDIRVNANDFAKQVGVLFKDQIPFATSYAINKTAQQAQIELSREMVRVFDNPTRYTLNGTFIVPSTVKRLYATIKMKDEGGKRSVPADKFITPNVQGGPRRLKGFERALERGYVADWMVCRTYTSSTTGPTRQRASGCHQSDIVATKSDDVRQRNAS